MIHTHARSPLISEVKLNHYKAKSMRYVAQLIQVLMILITIKLVNE